MQQYRRRSQKNSRHFCMNFEFYNYFRQNRTSLEQMECGECLEYYQQIMFLEKSRIRGLFNNNYWMLIESSHKKKVSHEVIEKLKLEGKNIITESVSFFSIESSAKMLRLPSNVFVCERIIKCREMETCSSIARSDLELFHKYISLWTIFSHCFWIKTCLQCFRSALWAIKVNL